MMAETLRTIIGKLYFLSERINAIALGAALSIFSKEMTDTQGNLLSAELSAECCGLMLDDMDKDTALNSISSLYSIYRPEDVTDGYFQSSRLELRKWYDRKEALAPETRPIKISFSQQRAT